MIVKKRIALVITVLLIVVNILNVVTLLSITGKATGTASMCILGPPNATTLPNMTITIGDLTTIAQNETPDCGESIAWSSFQNGSPVLASFYLDPDNGTINFTAAAGETGSYLIYINASKDGFPVNTTSFNLTVQGAFAPVNFSGRKGTDNSSINLTWANTSAVDNYTIYYSINISEIVNLDVTQALPANTTPVYNITDANWTDHNASNETRRYYKVSAYSSGTESLTSENAMGKFTIEYTVPDSTQYGSLTTNRFAIYLNVSYAAEEFLQEISSSLNPTISRLDKTNASGEFLTTHVQALDDGNNFTMEAGIGYEVTVDSNFSHTIVGPVLDAPYNLSYDVPDSTQYGALTSNRRGVFDFNKSYKAESFTAEINSSLNPTISRLDKTNASGEFLTTHVGGLNDGNNFSILVGTSYVITVDGNTTHVLCTTCFD
jgi:hypothetical protein